MKALCVVLTVLGIIVDEKHGSGVRHDNHICRQIGVNRPFTGTPMRLPSTCQCLEKCFRRPFVDIGAGQHLAGSPIFDPIGEKVALIAMERIN
jgi:hypothetical protein